MFHPLAGCAEAALLKKQKKHRDCKIAKGLKEWKRKEVIEMKWRLFLAVICIYSDALLCLSRSALTITYVSAILTIDIHRRQWTSVVPAFIDALSQLTFLAQSPRY